MSTGSLVRDFKHTKLDFEQFVDQKETEEDEEEAPKVLTQCLLSDDRPSALPLAHERSAAQVAVAWGFWELTDLT